MPTSDIPRQEWADFFDAFSRMHQGWLVTLEVIDEDIGDRLEAREARLSGVVSELRCHPEAIEVLADDPAGMHLSHTVREPVSVQVKETEAGAHEVLRLESQAGVVTLLKFARTALPSEVDGVVSAPRRH